MDQFGKTDIRFFHPDFVGFHRPGPYWIIGQFILLLNTIASVRRALVSIYPKLARLDLVALDNAGNVNGLAFLQYDTKVSARGYSANLGVGVIPKMRRVGLAKNLILYLINIAEKQSINSIHLEVMSDNHVAVKIYRELGFQTIGKRKDKWRGVEYDSIMMRRDFDGDGSC